MRWSKISALAVVGLGLVIGESASAGTLNAGTVISGVVLEYDFNNAPFNNGLEMKANIYANAGSPDAELVGSVRPSITSTYNASTGLTGPYFDSRLQTGYISLTPQGTNPAQAVNVENTTGNTDHYLGRFLSPSQTPTPTLDKGSIVMFFRPHVSGVTSARQTFFWSGPNNSSASLIWLMNDKTGALQLRTGSTGVAPANNGILAQIANVDYDSNTWYMLGASWEANDTGGAQNVLFLRAVSNGPAELTATSSVNLVDTNGQTIGAGEEMYIGRRGDTGFLDGLNADVSGFVLLNDSTTVGGFEQIYASVAPEPTSLGLLIFAGGFLMRRPRRA
jgi:hypothetical protein